MMNTLGRKLWGESRGRREGRAPQRRRRTLQPALLALEERLVLSTQIPIPASSWVPVGPAPILNGQTPGQMPVAGRVTAVAADPTNASVLYIGAASGGVWKTTDAGASWTPLTDDLPVSSTGPVRASNAIGALAIAPSDPKTLYAGTGEANNGGDSQYGRGILVTHDGGATWTVTGQNVFDRRTVSHIDVDPTNPMVAYAAISSFAVNGLTDGTGLFKTTDGGGTWVNTTASLSNVDQYTDVDIDPTNPSTVFMAIGTSFGSAPNGVYKSTDAGATWAPAGNFTMGTGDGRIEVAISPSDPKVLYAAITDPGTGAFQSMVKSTDGGATWNATTGTPPNYLGSQGWYDTTLIVDPADSNAVYAAGSFSGSSGGNFTGGLLTSRDGGANWVDLAVGANGKGPHVDYHASAFDASGKYLIGSDGGIFRLENPALTSITWSSLNTNLQITQFVGIAPHPTDADIAYGGSQDNGAEKFTGTTGWTLVQAGDGGYVRIDPTNPNTVYETYVYNSISRSDNAGQTWTDISAGLQGSGNFYSFYTVDQNGRVLFGTDRINVSTDKGATWSTLSTPGTAGWPSGQPVNAIAVAPTDARTIYAAAGGQVFVTTDNGGTWTARPVPGDGVAEIRIDAKDPKTAYAVRDVFGGGHVFKTTDGGASWKDLSGDFHDEPVHTMVDIPQTTGDVLVIGSDTGVYASFNGGANWVRFKAGMPNVHVSELEWVPALNILAAGTYGRGMWETFGATPLDINAATITPTENSDFTGAVATFKPGLPNPKPTDFTATINWGDLGASAGTIVANGDGSFSVIGSHQYAEGGSYVTSVQVNIAGGGFATATGKANVVDLPILAIPTTVRLKEGDAFKGTVASFEDTDPDILSNSVYSAIIYWADDNTNSPGLVLPDPNGLPNHFIVVGEHVFGGGTNPIVVTITGPGGGQAVANSTAVIQDSPLVLDNFLGTPAPVEGQTYTLPLVRFHDTDPRNPPSSNYQAVIDWGDGTTQTVGDITPDFNIPGAFLVSGSHTYSYGVSPYPVSVTISNHSGPNTLVADGLLGVSDAAMTATGYDYTVTEGVPFQNYLVSFQDADPRANPTSHYLATVDWGDGTTSQSQVGTAGALIMNDTDGGYLVRGSHAYALPGSYTYKIIVAQDNGDNTADATGTLTVPPAPIRATLATQAKPQEGQPFTGVVAQFTSANPLAAAGNFVATIHWGDGTTTTHATITRDAQTGAFLVRGAKSYGKYGTYNVSVSVVGPGGQNADAGGSITVTDAPLSGAGTTLNLTSKETSQGVVAATFTDADPSPRVSDDSATIAWGDGTTSQGTIVANGRGGFDVKGDHQYSRSGTYNVQVTIRSSGGSQTKASTQAQVAPKIYPLSGVLSSTTPTTATVTPVNTPQFSGHSEAGATVELYAIPTGTMHIVSIGSATADGQGSWTATSTVPLPDGSYSIVARATGPLGDVSSNPTYLLPLPSAGPLVVDTQGPTVQNVQVDAATGQVHVTLADSGTGLSYAGLINPSNFTLTVLGGTTNRVLHASGITVSPGAPGTVQTATISFAGLGRLNQGSYVLQISAPGVTDLAANPLDERFYIPFPGLYNRSGQNYTAQFSTNGQTVSPLTQYVPQVELTAAQRYRQRFLTASRYRRRG